MNLKSKIMKKYYTLVLVLFSILLNAQNPIVVKNVTTALKPNGNSTGPDLNYAKWNGKVFYTGTGSNTLCVTDGTTAGTVGISSLGGSMNVPNIIPAQDFVYVITSDITFSPFSTTDKIWKSDGTVAGTSLVHAFQTAPGTSNVGTFYSVATHKKNYSVDGNTLYFSAYDATNGKELWKTDGTAAGTMMLKDVKVGTGSSQTAGFCKIPSTTLFMAQSVGFESKLWKTDGTTGGTVQIPVDEPFFIVNQDMVKLGDKVIFFAHNTVDGYEPYVSDGTAAGTFMLKNINPTGNSLTAQAMGLHLKVAGSYCYFIASNGTNTSLWRTDGTIAGTIEVMPNVTNGISDTAYSTTDAENLWFLEYTGTSSSTIKLYKTNGTIEGSSLVHSTLSYAQNLTTYKGSAWFQSRDIGALFNVEVWRSDGLNENTQLALDVAGSSASSAPYNFFELNNKLYFFGANGSTHNLYQYTGDFTFNGSVNSDWNNKNNWNSNLLPISTDNVTIPSGYNVSTSANAYAKNISIASPITLNVGNLDIYGNATLSNSAKVTLNGNMLNLKKSNSSLLGNPTSYVVTNGIGKISVEKVDAARGIINLPIGNTTYNPITIANSGQGDTFFVRVEPGIATSYAGENQGTAMTANGVNATWYISEAVAGNSNATVSLQWNSAQELSGFDRLNAKMGHYNGSLWEGFDGTLSGTEPYVYTVNGISTFSPFSMLNSNILSADSVVLDKDAIILYPNPSNGEFTVEISNSFVGSKATIYNLLGQSVKEFTMNETIKNVSLNQGVYIVQIQYGNQVTTKKIIIQ